VSNLPIEPALAAGATEIIALDLIDPRDVQGQPQGMGPLLDHLIYTVEQRQQSLELALAAAQGVPVTHLHLFGQEPVPISDFRHTGDLIANGYQLARRALSEQTCQPTGKKAARGYPRLPIDWLRDWWYGDQTS